MALVLVLAGVLACFAGYRLFRIVLAIFGFILGAMLASSLMGISNAAALVVAALVGSGDPPVLAVIGLAVLGAIGAMFVQRHVIVVTTAFVGAWTLIVGILATAGDRGALAAKSASNVWILYPTTAPGSGWMPFVWVALGLAGTTMQLAVTGKKR